nr:unnamed protein product [Digitaria exilis]
MSDLIRVSSTAIQLLADKVNSGIKEEAEKWQIVERDLVFITGEFEMMQSFLNTADEEHIKNNVVRTWVRQVRDLSYDVEDCIEFVLHMDTKRSFKTLCLRLLSPFMSGKALDLDQAVTEITQLKARVMDVSQRNIRYNLIISDSAGSKPVANQKSAVSTDILTDYSPMMQCDLSNLVKLIDKDDNELQVISVCGTEDDPGKISIIENAYVDSTVREKFRCRAWVKPTHPFHPHEFIQNFVAQFNANTCHEQGRATIGIPLLKTNKDDIVSEFMEQVNNHRYLIILEDISTMAQWHAIMPYLPDRKNGSRIIVSTQQLEIARLCTGKPYRMMELSHRSADHSVCVFFKEVLEDNGCYLEKHMFTEEAEHILSKCGGLPRVIATLARYLATRPREALKQEMRHLSDKFMDELSTNPEFNSLRGLLVWMHSFLHACPQHLKTCMFYLSIFPQDVTIRRRRLVRRWTAEGYSKGTDSISMEKYREKLFDEVATLSIMQPSLSHDGNVTGYRVNGFFREYIVSRPTEEKIFFPVEVSKLEEEHVRLTIEGTRPHLAARTTLDNDAITITDHEVVFESLDFSRLRSLTLFELFLPYHISDRMRVLRVLDLENTNLRDDDLQSIGRLPHRLKFLSLRGNDGISRLPESMGLSDMVQLQTLDVRDTSISMLPQCITRLHKLQYIRAGIATAWTHDEDGLAAEEQSTSSSKCLPLFRRRGQVGSRSGGGVEVPKGIARLKSLQTLGAVNANAFILGETSTLSHLQLRKLELSISCKTRGRMLFWCDHHLESLSLQFEKTNHFVGWDDIFLPQTLRSLKMCGHIDQLPRGIKGLHNLLKLTLEMTTTLFTLDVVQVLGRLSSLRTLRLRVNKNQNGELQFPNAFFKKLQVLEIACKSKLHVWFAEGGATKLEQLKIHCLRGSELQFSGLENSVSLKKVWLLGSFDDALKEALQEQLDMHTKKPAPKLEVKPL